MEQRVQTALARIEAAAARIEAASRSNSVRVSGGGDDPLLAMKHAQLRANVGATLKELDALIGSLEHG